METQKPPSPQIFPPHLTQVLSMIRVEKGCLGSAGFRESITPCQEGRRGERGEIQMLWAKTWNFPDFPR